MLTVSFSDKQAQKNEAYSYGNVEIACIFGDCQIDVRILEKQMLYLFNEENGQRMEVEENTMRMQTN